MDLKELYPAFKAASEAMKSIYDPVCARYAEKFHITPLEMNVFSAVPTFEPNPVSPAILNIRSPYTAPEHYRSILEKLASEGLLKSVGADQFRITERGLEALKEILNAIYNTMAGLQSFSVTKMMDLASRLKELADACMGAPDPPGIWCIQHERRKDPGSGSPMMARIDQFLSELLAFRDDANLAAWRRYKCSGHTWEVLTLLWVEQESSVEEINRALQRRGFSVEQTEETVDKLLKREWLRQLNGRLRISPIGAEIRHTAEMTTDRFYLERFSCFSGLELARTLELIKEHRRGFRA